MIDAQNESLLLSMQFDKTKDNKQTLYKKVEIIRNILSLKIEDNKNLKKIATNLNIAHIITTNKLGQINGLLDKQPNLKPVILINSEAKCKTFVLAHELVHLFLSPYDQGFKDLNLHKYKSKKNSYEEWRANEGAAQLLIPENEIIEDFNYLNLYKDFNDIVKELADKYSVSESIIKIRLKNLNIK